MAQATDPAARPPAAAPAASPPIGAGGAAANPPLTPDSIREAIQSKFVCPFCGSVNDTEQGTCPRCTMENTAASRKATKVRIGPWYVLQTRNPAAPGMKFDTLLSFAKKGRVKPQSVVRGPTTHQLWRFAAQVKGLSREFGVCYSCGSAIATTASLCPQCNRLQDAPPNPDVLLESSKEATASPSPGEVAPPAAPKPKEPSLESADADFVVPALGGGAGGLGDSLAGFSMHDSIAGMTIDQPWARIDPAGRAANGRTGTGRPTGGRPAPAREPAGMGFTSAAPPPAARPAPPPASAASAANGKKPAEGFLSARDLAAAFKLEVAGEAETSPGRAPRQPFTPPPSEPAEIDPDVLFNTPRPRMRPRRRGGFLKFLLILLLLAAAGYGAAYYLSETVRVRSRQWFEKAKTAMLEGDPAAAPRRGRAAGAGSGGGSGTGQPAAASVLPLGGAALRPPVVSPTGSASPAPAVPAASPAKPTGPATLPVAAATQPAVASAIATPPEPPSPPTIPARIADGASAAADATLSATRVDGVVWQKVAKDADREKAAGARTPTTAPVAAPAPSSTDTAARDAAEAWQLYLDAVDAEGRRDWAEAVRKYKAIRAYSKSVWPRNLDTNQAIAERQLAGSP